MTAAIDHATDHDYRVEVIAQQVRDLGGGGTAHIDKGGVHHVVPLPRDRRFTGRRVDASSLTNILDIDVDARTATMEAGVTFAQLVDATTRHGLVPMVVPELEGITVGGAVAGCSVESSSFRHGGFHDTCLEYELITGTGDVITLDRAEDPSLFDMVHGSYGTLGILTRLTCRLVPAQPYVRIAYRTLTSADAFHRAATALIEGGEHDFIDAIVHARDRHILCVGDFVDDAPYVSDYRRLDIYYRSTTDRLVDHLTTRDYFFRYDTEAHWLTATVPPLQWRPVRRVLGGAFLGSTNLIKWSNRLEPILRLKRRPDLVVDVFIPADRAVEFLHWYERTLGFHPLWVVPYRIPEPYPWVSREHNPIGAGALFYDFAVYGMRDTDRSVDRSQLLEDKTYELGGIKTLISRNHHTRERFWSVYDRPNYEAAKARLDPRGLFPDLYDKFHAS